MADYPLHTKSGADRFRDSHTGTDNVPHDFGSSPHQEIILKALNADFVGNVKSTFTELQDLLLSKHRDYGAKNISHSPGGALNGLRVRIHDKQARINNLIDNNLNPEHEALEDSFKDMANYAIIALLVLRNQWDKE